MVYDYECIYCGQPETVECKMSEREKLWPVCKNEYCDREGEPLTALITNNQKHVDNTGTRKGYFNSKEGKHR